MSSAVAVAKPQVPSSDLAQLSWKTKISTDYAADQPFTKVWVTQGFLGGMPIANIPHLSSTNPSNPKEGLLCDQVDETCLPTEGWTAFGYGAFQLCATSKVAPCIRGLEYSDEKGEWHEAVLRREIDLSTPAESSRSWLRTNNYPSPGSTLLQFQTKWGWDANPENGLPGSGKGPLLFDFPGRPNASGEFTYALDANFKLEATRSSTGQIKQKVTDFDFQISPVKDLTCSNSNVSVYVMFRKADGNIGFGQTGGSCIDPSLYTSPDSAGFATKFADNFPIRLNLELPNNLSGWFQGRLDSPEITVKSLTAETSDVQITGKPIVVPATNKALDLNDPKNQELLGGSDYDWARQTQANGYFGITGPIWQPNAGVGVFNRWLPYLDKQARGSVSMWSVSHFMSFARCMNGTDGLQGLVTTNAMVYQPSTPSFDGSFLQYQVGGVHLDQDGNTVLGTYNFLMKHSVAQCLYGFSSAPISGTVSVVSSEGQEQVAYTNVVDKDGWLKLTAEGFTFSSPTISAQLTQPKPPSPTSTDTPSPVKKTTIKCVKGKAVKRVSGVKPKCPKGFKKK